MNRTISGWDLLLHGCWKSTGRLRVLPFAGDGALLECARFWLERVVDGVYPEAINAALEPEPRTLEQRVLHGGMVHVQVGLPGQEIVKIVLPASRIPRPGGTAEHRLPVRRRRAVRFGICPDIPLGLCIGAILAALPEPWMLIGSMRVDLVDDDPQPQGMRRLQQAIEIPQRSEARIDAAVVGNVVAEVPHRGGEERAQPDRIHSQRSNIRQMGGDARQIADPIPVRVGKAARVNLIDARPAPPFPPGAHCPAPEAQTM